jgi:hypothetical protein
MNVGVANSDQNPNTSWLNSKGIWFTYVIFTMTMHLILLSFPFLTTAMSWTLTNVCHNVVGYFSFLWVLIIVYCLVQDLYRIYHTRTTLCCIQPYFLKSKHCIPVTFKHDYKDRHIKCSITENNLVMENRQSNGPFPLLELWKRLRLMIKQAPLYLLVSFHQHRLFTFTLPYILPFRIKI